MTVHTEPDWASVWRDLRRATQTVWMLVWIGVCEVLAVFAGGYFVWNHSLIVGLAAVLLGLFVALGSAFLALWVARFVKTHL